MFIGCEWIQFYKIISNPYYRLYFTAVRPPAVLWATKCQSFPWAHLANMTSVQSVSVKKHFTNPEGFPSTTSGSERTLCWLQPSCATRTSSWSRCPPSHALPAAPEKAFRTCVCVCVCCPGTLWSSISWRGSAVGSLWEGWAPERDQGLHRIWSDFCVYALMEQDQQQNSLLGFFASLLTW